MDGLKNFKLGLTFFAGFVLGIAGIYKSDHATKVPLFTGDRISTIENSDVQMCQTGATEKNVSLFVSCAGFLE